MNRTAQRSEPKPATAQAAGGAARADLVARTLTRTPVASVLDRAIADARDALAARQSPEGYWLFELEADCTIPAEYIMMMHFLDELDAPLERKLAAYLRQHQAGHGGWPLYHGGDFNMSCTVKSYYALKLAGDDPSAPAAAPEMTENQRPARWLATSRRRSSWRALSGGSCRCLCHAVPPRRNTSRPAPAPSARL